jgi:hypothetical protein
MRSPGRILALLAALVLLNRAPVCAVCRAADAAAPTPTPVAVLLLRDGRALHNVRVMSSGPDGIVVNGDEGLMKIPRANLPDAVANALPAPKAGGADMVMQPFNPDMGPPAPTPTPKPRPPQRPTAAPKPTPNPVFRGCTIASFQVKPFQNVLGSAEVVIRNDTDSAVAILPGDITCVTDSGALHRGRQFVVNAYPPIVRRRETVPARGTLDEQVTFTNEALQITAVRWSR